MKDSVFIMSVLIAAAPISRSATWTPVNDGLPAQTLGIRAVVADTNDAATVYALTTRGSIYRTTDAAATWRAVSGASVTSLAIDPTNASTIYATTAHGIVKSVDGGAGWIAANGGLDAPPLSAFGLTIDPVNPSTLYAINQGNGSSIRDTSILKTTDGAVTWHPIYTFANPNVADFRLPLTIDPVTPSTLYALSGGGAIFKSTDGAGSWRQIKPAGPGGFVADLMTLAIDSQNSSTIYAGSFANTTPPLLPNRLGAGAVVKSGDGGQTWRTIRAGIPADAFVRRLVVDRSAPSTLYAAYLANAGAGILKSVNAGESWSVVYRTSDITAIVVTVGPSGVYAAYAGGSGGGMLHSIDGGSTWNPANTGLEYVDVRVLATNPLHPGALYVGGVGGLFKRAEAETSWTTLNLPSIAAESRFGVPASDSLVRSLAIDITNPDVLYVNAGRLNACVYDDQVLFKTTDGGASWSNSISPPLSGCLLGGYFTTATTPVLITDLSDSQSLYLAEGEDEDGGYVLLKSTDGGANWNRVWDFSSGLQTGINALVIDRSNPTTLYAGLGDASPYGPSRPAIGFFKSTDGGATWTNMGLTDAAVTVLVPDPFESNTLYAAAHGIYTNPPGFRGIFKTVDGGISWCPINDGLDRLTQAGAAITAMAIDPANPGTMYAGTSGAGVFKTIDGGASWAPFNEGLSSFDIRTLAIAADGVYAATAAGVFRAQRECAGSGVER
jgi:photosystem II stability/assembly factor-like uncharacterized protein